MRISLMNKEWFVKRASQVQLQRLLQQKKHTAKQVPVAQKRATVVQAVKNCDCSRDRTRQRHYTADGREDRASVLGLHQ